MKTSILALSALLLTGSFGMVSYADAVTMLAAKDGMTVYVFDKDTGGTPSCYNDCATKWPPYIATAGESLGEGWTQVARTDGTSQWAYDGKPLYFYAGDNNKGDHTGDGLGGVWHIIVE
jgi:predicted lipoprotein with Yx(FWY)xxD motif